MDELEAEVIRHYGPIPNLNLAPTHFPVPPLSDKEFKVGGSSS